MGTILEDTKKALGIVPNYDAFDDQILMHINTARMDLVQLGQNAIPRLKRRLAGMLSTTSMMNRPSRATLP